MCWCFLSCVFSGNFHRVLSLLGWTLHTVEGICHLCMCQERESPYSRSIKVECRVQVRKSNLFNQLIQWKSGYFTSHCACFVSPTVVQRMPERTCELNPVAYPKVRINIHPVACCIMLHVPFLSSTTHSLITLYTPLDLFFTVLFLNVSEWRVSIPRCSKDEKDLR